MKLMIVSVLILSAAFAVGQRGTESGFGPIGWSGDIFTGVLTGADDGTRELTLTYMKGDKTETFTGTLQPGYKIAFEDGSVREVKPSEFPTGSKMTVYFTAKQKKVDGQKVKTYEIFRVKFLPKSS